jgi:enoyl-CoA hydratase/carnithine racemase
MASLVTLTEETNYCLICLDDGKANAISPDLAAQLNEALDRAEAIAKVVVIMGRPGKFSAGFDLSIMGQGGDAMVSLLRDGATLSLRLLRFPTPVVLAASGHALAMGALLLLSADYRIGVEGDFKIGLNEVAIGMTLPYFGVELAQSRLAKNYLNRAVTQAAIFSPVAAIEAGFLDEVIAPEQLLDRAAAYAEQLSGLDLAAHKGSKERIRADLYLALEEAIEKELGQ